MAFFRKKEAKPAVNPPFARAVNVMVMAVIGYMFWSNMTSTPATTTPLANAPTAAPELEEASLPGRMRYIEAAQLRGLAQLQLSIRTKAAFNTLALGDGSELTCGQRVTLKLDATGADNGKPVPEIASLLPEQVRLQLGVQATPRDALLHALVLGLKEHGQREIMLPFGRLLHVLQPDLPLESVPTAAADRLVRVVATVINAAPKLPQTTAPATVLDTQFGDSEHLVACGVPVRFSVRLWRVDGSIYRMTASQPETQVFTATLGHGQLPYALERALEGMGVGGRRTVLMPPAWHAPFAGGSSPLPLLMAGLPKEYLLAEIHVLHADEVPPLPLVPEHLFSN